MQDLRSYPVIARLAKQVVAIQDSAIFVESRLIFVLDSAIFTKSL
ncbi:hypothetical protein ACWIUD_08180 [Helicobacter sp. 23-1044]